MGYSRERRLALPKAEPIASRGIAWRERKVRPARGTADDWVGGIFRDLEVFLEGQLCWGLLGALQGVGWDGCGLTATSHCQGRGSAGHLKVSCLFTGRWCYRKRA